MSETSLFILAVIVIVFVVFHLWYVNSRDKREKDIIRAILSRNAYEYSETKLMEKSASKDTKNADDDLLTPSELMSNEQFAASIKKQLSH